MERLGERLARVRSLSDDAHDPINGRLLCRPHNRLSAEQAYGQQTITRIITRRRRARPPANSVEEPSTT
jgi:hypothetical protein